MRSHAPTPTHTYKCTHTYTSTHTDTLTFTNTSKHTLRGYVIRTLSLTHIHFNTPITHKHTHTISISVPNKHTHTPSHTERLKEKLEKHERQFFCIIRNWTSGRKPKKATCDRSLKSSSSIQAHWRKVFA